MSACLWPLPPGYTYTKEHMAPIKVTAVVICSHHGSILCSSNVLGSEHG